MPRVHVIPTAEVEAEWLAGASAKDLATRFRCTVPSIYRAIRRIGLGSTIRARSPLGKPRIVRPITSGAVTREPIGVNQLPRVDRDPCFKCGTRADVGCQHNRSAAA